MLVIYRGGIIIEREGELLVNVLK